jgi:aryl-alcohol dehydrogenase-like predicted oxidoreductase
MTTIPSLATCSLLGRSGLRVSPLASGLLSGKYTREGVHPKGAGRLPTVARSGLRDARDPRADLRRHDGPGRAGGVPAHGLKVRRRGGARGSG